MPGKLQNDRVSQGWRSRIIFILLLIMMIALFFSRGILSVSIMAFVIASLFHKDILNHFRKFLSSPLLWGMSLLFFLPLLTGLWSENKTDWLDVIRIKLPLLFLPLAFAGPLLISAKKWEWLGFVFILLILGATIWSLFHYTADIAQANEGYLRSKSIRTPLENDHVRFSWLVAVAILLASWFCIRESEKNKLLSWSLGIVGGWMIVYLHILAARTGLFSFYILILVTSGWLLWRKLKWSYGLLLLGSLLLLPLIAYFTLPTFQNRVKYIRYEFDFFKHADYRPGFNDGIRLISINAGWQLVKQKPLAGTGFGDIQAETNKWYQEHYPQMIPADRISPSSEWMIYGVGAGTIGLLAFLYVMAIPFFIGLNHPLWWMLNLVTAFSFLFDIGLEVQFGVFIYSFIVLWWYNWIRAEGE